MIYDVIGEHQPTPKPDTWNCPLSKDGTFHVKVIRIKIDNVEPVNNEVIIPWIHDIPLKVNTFIWKANLGRIPTNVALKKRGVTILHSTCS